ncbi:MAG TPA: PilZ domain-containing protein [Myxococcota bacterium]|nr:PilZ domain-containing protein [Myxococcota bacterium]
MSGGCVSGRVLERSKRRMTCRVHVDGRQHNGIVLDLSGSGLFIQTSAKLAPGSRVDIDLSLPDDNARMQIEVVRRKQVPAQLLTVAQGGLGVRILSAPEGYYRFLHELQEKERELEGRAAAPPQAESPRAASPSPAPARAASPARPAPVSAKPAAAPQPTPAPPPKPEPPKLRFRVRVCQTQGARSRVVDVAAASAEAAARQVLGELGDEWKLLKVDPI